MSEKWQMCFAIFGCLSLFSIAQELGKIRDELERMRGKH